MAVLNAADVGSADDLRRASSTTWVKMADISVEGLRQAFLVAAELMVSDASR